MKYYKGLSLVKLDKITEAEKIFNALIEEGENALEGKADKDAVFYTIFDEKQFESETKSRAYTIRGLGYKGLDKNQQAREDLQRAEDLFHSNLWAKIELKELQMIPMAEINY